MKVKIGGVIYDSDIEPVMIMLTTQDKKNINQMSPEATCYASFPNGWGDVFKMRDWMKPADFNKPFLINTNEPEPARELDRTTGGWIGQP